MIVTAGCGISQSSFEHWPTWTKYIDLTHNVKHKNIGGPAAGNEFIGESVIQAINDQNVDTVIITWTDCSKIDFYIEDQQVGKQILSFPSRNWLIDHNGKIQNTVPNWWPSSVTNDNDPKKVYNKFFNNKFQQKSRLLTYIKLIQDICSQRNINCVMFFSYKTDCTQSDFDRYNIDTDFFPTTEPLANNFFNGKWRKYQTTDKFGLVPVAGWHWEIYKKYILSILDSRYTRNTKINLDKLEQYALEKTEECFQNRIS